MKTHHIEQALFEAGFTKKEIHIYFALLALGKEKVSRIARRASINRSTAYVILDSLIEKGVVTMTGKEPKQEYFAESPDKVLAYVSKKISKTKEALDNLTKILPDLTSMYNKEGRPQVIFYEGKDGIKQVYEDTLTSYETIRAFAHLEPLQERMGSYFPDYYRRRAKKKIAIKAIFPNTPEGRNRKKFDAKELRESLLVPSEKFSGTPELNIYDDKILIASWRENLGIIIKSHEIATMLKNIYDMAWEEAKRLNLKNENNHLQ